MGFELLIFALNPIANAWWDAKHGETSHFKSWLIKGAVLVAQSIAMSFIFTNPWPEIIGNIWWVYLLIGIAVEWTFFDYLYNSMKDHSWDYIGEEKYHQDDWTWKIYNKLGAVIILFLKLWFLATTVSIYFYLDLI